jgi:hypothetical protein
MSVKNSSDTIGNRNRDLPACSVVPEPPIPPHAQKLYLLTKDLFIYGLFNNTASSQAILHRVYDPLDLAPVSITCADK